MDYLESSTETTGIKNATSVAFFRRNNPKLCEGYEGSQLKPRLADDASLIRPTEIDIYHFVIWRPPLSEGHEGSQ